MKEKLDVATINSEEHSSINDIKVNHDDINNLRKIITIKNSFLIYLKNKKKSNTIEISKKSFNKINSMINSHPEEFIVFVYDNKTIHTLNRSLTNSTLKERNSSSLSFSESIYLSSIHYLQP